MNRGHVQSRKINTHFPLNIFIYPSPSCTTTATKSYKYEHGLTNTLFVSSAKYRDISNDVIGNLIYLKDQPAELLMGQHFYQFYDLEYLMIYLKMHHSFWKDFDVLFPPLTTIYFFHLSARHVKYPIKTSKIHEHHVFAIQLTTLTVSTFLGIYSVPTLDLKFEQFHTKYKRL
ncbi:hypothetical protein AGLY_004638 [Aphis glycines]|uniref:Uncharacterized protein n=1 Tax=Aphis glycines TaxID=307491 RepID=A0A6G0TVR0_APHGL|nr:hypothetical protein AGLY_004638 [Aphis glycines]